MLYKSNPMTQTTKYDSLTVEYTYKYIKGSNDYDNGYPAEHEIEVLSIVDADGLSVRTDCENGKMESWLEFLTDKDYELIEEQIIEENK